MNDSQPPPSETPPISADSSMVSTPIKAVVAYEMIKGLGAILVAFALWKWHHNLQDWIGSIQSIWLEYFGSLFKTQVDATILIAQRAAQNWQLFMILVFGYASIRFIEAYGLWKDKTWAYWFSVLGYGVFLPLEVYYLIVRPFDWFKLLVLIMNVVVVIVVYRQMRRKGLL